MRARETLVVLAFGTATVVYGACTDARLHALGGADASADGVDTEAGLDREADGSADAGTGLDAKPLDAAADSRGSEWPCGPPADGGTLFDREWITGPIPASSPGAANYALKAASACDRTTLLEWERTVSSPMRTWDQAAAYCDSLLLEGASDWRLPTRIELLTIVDFARKEPAIEPSVFLSTPSAAFWSATLMSNVFTNSNAYLVAFDFGHAFPFTKDEPAHVRCVRGGR